jgi:hypothetical protein
MEEFENQNRPSCDEKRVESMWSDFLHWVQAGC